ncbi:MAG: hypothetical protein ACAH11_13615 [Sphingomonas sp.]
MILLPLLLLAAPVQETGIMGFVYQATYRPPRTRAEAEKIMLNHEMKEVRDGVFIIDVFTTDGGITRAEFHEPQNTWSQAMLLLTFSNECEPRDSVLSTVPKYRRVGKEWLGEAEWGRFAYTFDDTPKHCLATFRMYVNPATQPSETN